MTVNKKEFADRMAENGGITKKAAFQAVGLFIQTLMEYLSEDEKVMFTNFGRFEMKYVKERVGCNPQDGSGCVIPGHRKVKFTASGSLAERIMEGQEEKETDENE